MVINNVRDHRMPAAPRAEVRDHRTTTATPPTSGPVVRDHRGQPAPANNRPDVRDHRTQGPANTRPQVVDHRTPAYVPAAQQPGYVWKNDHWERTRAPSTNSGGGVVVGGSRPPVLPAPPPQIGNTGIVPPQYTSAQDQAAIANMGPAIRDMYNQMMAADPKSAGDFLHRMMG